MSFLGTTYTFNKEP